MISWHPNTDGDLLGYKVYYGTQSRRYSSVRPVGDDTTCTLSGLRGGRTYFITLTAYDKFSNESDYSPEISFYIEPERTPEEQLQFVQKCYNFPNPFRPPHQSTSLRYFLENPGRITIEIINVNGAGIAIPVNNAYKEAGEHTEDVWDGCTTDGSPVQNGVYYCRIISAGVNTVFPIVVIQ
jgi:hypothetical protein